MEWAETRWFYGLLVLPLLLSIQMWAEARNRRSAAVWVDPALAPRLIPRRQAYRTWLSFAAVAFAFLAGVVALAGPRWGKEAQFTIERRLDCVVLLDLSRSMLAEDVAPNRLERAKGDLRDLLAKLVGDRVGLVGFAGVPILKVPLTTDQAYFRSVMDSLSPDSMPRGGSDLASAIDRGLEALPANLARDQILLLISDGGDNDEQLDEAIARAKARGVRIYTVGLGDPQKGAIVPDKTGKKALVYQGEPVQSKLEPARLRKIADETEGVYLPVETRTFDLGRLYDEHLLNLDREETRSKEIVQPIERFGLFLALAVVALLAAEWNEVRPRQSLVVSERPLWSR